MMKKTTILFVATLLVMLTGCSIASQAEAGIELLTQKIQKYEEAESRYLAAEKIIADAKNELEETGSVSEQNSKLFFRVRLLAPDIKAIKEHQQGSLYHAAEMNKNIYGSAAYDLSFALDRNSSTYKIVNQNANKKKNLKDEDRYKLDEWKSEILRACDITAKYYETHDEVDFYAPYISQNIQ